VTPLMNPASDVFHWTPSVPGAVSPAVVGVEAVDQILHGDDDVQISVAESP
jgi:hypothetical protein